MSRVRTQAPGTQVPMTPIRNRWMTPRARGAISGMGLLLLGAWAALIPFVGPYFHFGFTPDSTWTWTAGRGLLEVLPGAVAFVAGFVLLATRHRAVGVLASWLGTAAGAWLVVGPLVAPLWRSSLLGTPLGDATDRSMAQLGMFFGVGALMMFLAGTALGRFSVIGVRDVAYVEALHAEETAAGDYSDYRDVASREGAYADYPAAAPTAAAPVATTRVTRAPAEIVDDDPEATNRPAAVASAPTTSETMGHQDAVVRQDAVAQNDPAAEGQAYEPVAEGRPRHSFRHRRQRTPASH